MEGRHRHHPSRGRVRDYVADFFRNWREYRGPLREKIWLTVRNRARAYAPPFPGCCGHPGQPGC